MTDYADLIRKIKILETQLELTEAELTYWRGGTSVIFNSKGSAKFGMMAAIDNVEDLQIRGYRQKKMLDFYKEIEEEVRENVYALDGLPFVIARMRFIEDMSYQEIAEELNLTYGYVRQVVSKSNKERTAILEKP